MVFDHAVPVPVRAVVLRVAIPKVSPVVPKSESSMDLTSAVRYGVLDEVGQAEAGLPPETRVADGKERGRHGLIVVPVGLFIALTYT